MNTSRRSVPAAALLAAALAVVAVSTAVVRSPVFAAEPGALSLAVTFDLVVFLPGLYLLVAWRRGWPRVSAIPVFGLCLATAYALLPAVHQGYLEALEPALALLELAVLGLIAWKARQVGRELRRAGASGGGASDFPERFETALVRVLGHLGVARILATEASVLRYGLAGWGRAAARGEGVFSYHRKSGYGAIVGVFVWLILMETAGLHLLLSRWSPAAAWVLTGLTLYGVVFLLADYHAMRHRPLRIEDGELRLTVGLRWRLRLPLAEILEARVSGADPGPRQGLLAAAVLRGRHNVLLTLHRSHRAVGFYGLTRECERLALTVDDPEAFVRALGER